MMLIFYPRGFVFALTRLIIISKYIQFSYFFQFGQSHQPFHHGLQFLANLIFSFTNKLYCLLMPQYIMLFIIFQTVFPTTFFKDYILKLLLLASSSAKLHFDTKAVLFHLIMAWWKPCRENSSFALGLSEHLWFCFRRVRKAAAGSPKPEEKSSSLYRKAKFWLWQRTFWKHRSTRN